MKTEIFETKVHYPIAGSEISTECKEMFERIKPWHSEIMMFNETLIIMAHKDDVHYVDILDTEFGRLKNRNKDWVEPKAPII
jgi:hypothetical protein